MTIVSTWPLLPTCLLAVASVLAPCAAGGGACAQDVPWPRCSQRLEGQSLCGQGSVCECHYDSGGILTGRVAAWRWSCDILKMCGGPVPAGAPDQPLPPGFTYAPNMSASPDATQPPISPWLAQPGRRRVPGRVPGDAEGP